MSENYFPKKSWEPLEKRYWAFSQFVSFHLLLVLWAYISPYVGRTINPYQFFRSTSMRRVQLHFGPTSCSAWILLFWQYASTHVISVSNREIALSHNMAVLGLREAFLFQRWLCSSTKICQSIRQPQTKLPNAYTAIETWWTALLLNFWISPTPRWKHSPLHDNWCFYPVQWYANQGLSRSSLFNSAQMHPPSGGLTEAMFLRIVNY